MSSSGAGGNRRPTIRTLADLSSRPAASSGDSDDEPQEYYTGGEKSGMLVQDPTKKNDPDAIFEQVRQMRGHDPSPDVQPPSESRIFSGTARLLSGGTVPAAPQQQQPAVVNHLIQFWNNGFTVDDGPLRSYDDPANAPFLESIRNSVCPTELEPADRGTEINVKLMKRLEDYKEPAKPREAFQGVGRTLGSGSSDASSSSASAPTPAIPPSSRPIGISVDGSLPSTSIQLRLADGTRMVARFNLHHTVGDIRAFIDASRPGAPAAYHLQTGFPPKTLADLTKTIEEAGLANSVVVQKLS